MKAGDADLPERAEALLAAWPDGARPESAWDDLAARVDARVLSTAVGSTDDALLAAPLPAAAGEPQGAEGADDAEPPTRASGEQPRSLADLARSVAQARNDDVVAIAHASLSLAARERLVGDPALVAAGHERDAPPSAPASVPAASLDDRRARAVPTATREPRGAWLLGAGTAAVGIAAAIALFVSRPAPSGDPAVASVAPGAPQEAASSAVPTTPLARPAEDGVVDLDDLPRGEPGATAPSSSDPKVVVAQGAPAARPSLESSGGAGVEPAAPAEQPAAPAAKAAEADDPGLKMAAEAEPARLQPSTGEVQAALGAVMGNARACVAALDQPSRAAVTFGSDGRVSGVAVSGAAAGTPASACIEGALRRARVAPFSKPAFTAAATVRP